MIPFGDRLQLNRLKNELSAFYSIGKQLSAEKDINKLLDLIINSSMQITDSDAGTVYVVIDPDTNKWSTFERNKNKRLKFTVTKNKSVEISRLNLMTTEINKKTIIGNVVITGKPLRIDNVYDLSNELKNSFDDSFDKLTGYKTKSMLTVPMKDHQDRVIGIIQLLNKKKLNAIAPFSDKDEMMIYSLAGQAAIALENSLIYRDMQELLEQHRQTISEEIAKRKESDEEIEKLLNAVEHSPVTVTITDVSGNIEYVNPKFSQITGYQIKEVIGKNANILFKSGKHSKEFYESFWNAILSGKEWCGEFYNKKKNGDYYWETASISSIKDKNGNIKYFIAVKEDITEKKRLYEEIEKQNIRLQDTIHKLNETQSQLVHKEKMAAIGQLAAGVAHEINNPLGFVMSNYETLQTYMTKFKELIQLYREFVHKFNERNECDLQEIQNIILKNEQKFNLDFILEDLAELFLDTKEGLERVGNIVNALRTFSHIDQIQQYNDYDLNEGIRTTLIIANNKIKYNAKVYKDLNELPFIKAKGGEINQVLLNLILNAAYAVEKKNSQEEGKITVKTYQEGNYVKCEIEDNGIGIADEYLNKIFDPFFTTKPVGEGTGLGLSLSYDIITNKHKGDIRVQSQPGVGTTFTFRLPI